MLNNFDRKLGEGIVTTKCENDLLKAFSLFCKEIEKDKRKNNQEEKNKD